MVYINIVDHQKFISLCKKLLVTEDENSSAKEDKKTKLRNDLKELEELAEKYRLMLSELPKLSHEYVALHKQIRINLRRLHLKQKEKTSNNNKL